MFLILIVNPNYIAMKKILLALIFPIMGVSQTVPSAVHLVNHDYPFYVNVANPSDLNSINWGAEFTLPNRFINSWQYLFTFSSNGSWDVPIKHGFSHTFSWFNEADKTVVPEERRDKMWGGPGCNVHGFFDTYRTNSAYYNEMFEKFKHTYKTGDNISWTGDIINGYTCPTTPSISPLKTNSGDFWVGVYDSSGVVVKNTGIHSMDYEVQYGIDRHYGSGALDSWLQCLKDNNTGGSCASFVDGSILDVSKHMPTPSYLSTLSFAEFKKVYFRARIKDLNCSLEAYKSLMTNPGLYNNWGTDIEDVNIFNTSPNITWAQLTTDATNLSYIYRDTTNFTTYGNYYVNNLGIHTSVNYFPQGRLGNYSNYTGTLSHYTSGYWLQNTLYTLELMKAWNPNKPCLNYIWMKNDGPILYSNRMDSLVAEALPIFTMLSGADGNIMWDQEGPGANNHIYDYYIKGMRRLSHFNSILTPTNVTYYKNYDPIQIRNMQNAANPSGTYTFGIARGIAKGDSILIAAMNPNAQIGQVTHIPIVFSNGSYTFTDTITVIGRKTFLGAAKMTATGTTTSTTCNGPVTLASNPNPVSTCNGVTTHSIAPPTSGFAEYSTNGVTWHPSNSVGGGYTYTLTPTPNCVSWWVRPLGCPTYSTWGCYLGQSTLCATPCTNSVTLQSGNNNPISTCNGITTHSIAPPTSGAAEYSTDGNTWHPSNNGDGGYTYTLTATPNCVSWWVRPLGCPTYSTWGCYLGQTTNNCMTTGLTTMDVYNNIIVFPNPSKNEINILGIEPNQIYKVSINDLLGREVLVSHETKAINIDKLVSGNYFISVYNKDFIPIKHLRFVKE